MAIIYHGISYEKALHAGSRGAVLSVLDERIEEDEVKFFKKHGFARDKCWSITTEKVQIGNLEWELEKKMAPGDIVLSTQYVPVVTSLDLPKLESLGWKNEKGALVLGVFMDDPILEKERSHDSDPAIKYICRRLDLMLLDSVYISGSATKEQARETLKAFARYRPHFFKINQ
jgi:hypothetical protein